VIEPRLMSGADAAAYCGVTAASWSKWVAAGTMPVPVAGTRRWDRKAIVLTLDKASGILPLASEDDEAKRVADEWERKYEARKAARELDTEYIRKGAARKPAFANRSPAGF
jgi:hypothetical protein